LAYSTVASNGSSLPVMKKQKSGWMTSQSAVESASSVRWDDDD
jgi:hypothetical protein